MNRLVGDCCQNDGRCRDGQNGISWFEVGVVETDMNNNMKENDSIRACI